jgi:hypothetical protein
MSLEKKMLFFDDKMSKNFELFFLTFKKSTFQRVSMKEVFALMLVAASLRADFQNTSHQMIKYHLSEAESDIFILKDIDDQDLQNCVIEGLYKVKLDHLPSYTFFTKIPFEHFQAHAIDQDNFIIELACSHKKDLIYVGHLPSLTSSEISFLKTSIQNSFPYIHKLVAVI